jgi:hypothetical protein
MIMHHLLHLHESQATTMPMITHQLGVITEDGIDLHLGQNPKLGGRYTDDSLIYTSYLVGTLYIHVLLSLFSLLFLFLFLLSKAQKDPKNLLFLFVCLFSSLALVCLSFSFWYLKNPKNILLCLLFPSVLVSKFENPKIFVVLFQFCKVCCRVQSPATPLELDLHFILFKPNK